LYARSLQRLKSNKKSIFFTISLIIWHKYMNIKTLMRMSSYFLSTLPKIQKVQMTELGLCMNDPVELLHAALSQLA
ncbi:MAG: hypothetical protein SOT67_07140, partial [Bacteroidaceae bacterium]|nr:hypothetical protein [Bacteroidaceae bacterium]